MLRGDGLHFVNFILSEIEENFSYSPVNKPACITKIDINATFQTYNNQNQTIFHLITVINACDLSETL